MTESSPDVAEEKLTEEFSPTKLVSLAQDIVRLEEHQVPKRERYTQYLKTATWATFLVGYIGTSSGAITPEAAAAVFALGVGGEFYSIISEGTLDRMKSNLADAKGKVRQFLETSGQTRG